MIDRLCSLHDLLITFQDDFRLTKHKFCLKSGFPDIIGAIDCAHTKAQNFGQESWERYRNMKGFFPLNVQGVCDTNLLFLDIVVQWPGSVYDSRIFNASRLKERLESGELNGMLFGDSGYPLVPFLMTPFSDANTPIKRRNLYYFKLIIKMNLKYKDSAQRTQQPEW